MLSSGNMGIFAFSEGFHGNSNKVYSLSNMIVLGLNIRVTSFNKVYIISYFIECVF